MGKKAKASKSPRVTKKSKSKAQESTPGSTKISALLDSIKPCLFVLGGADEFGNVLHFVGPSVSAYNYKVFATVRLPGDLSVDGVVEGKLLQGILSSMPDGDVTCVSSKKEIKLVVGSSELVLQRRDSKAFTLPSFEFEEGAKGTHELSLEGSQITDWTSALGRCLICCDSSVLDASLLGVWVRISDAGVEMAASDGFRIGLTTLGKESVPKGLDKGKEFKMFLSMDLANLLVASLPGTNVVQMTVTPSWVDVKSERGRFVGMQVSHETGKGTQLWSAFDGFIAEHKKTEEASLPKRLPALLESAMALATRYSAQCLVSLSISNGELVLEAGKKGGPSGSITHKGLELDHDNIRLTVNGNFLAPVLPYVSSLCTVGDFLLFSGDNFRYLLGTVKTK